MVCSWACVLRACLSLAFVCAPSARPLVAWEGKERAQFSELTWWASCPVPQVTHIAGRRIKFAAEAETVGVVVPCSDAEAVERVSALYRTKHIVLLALACCPSQPRAQPIPVWRSHQNS